jgi:hypothetical protein
MHTPSKFCTRLRSPSTTFTPTRSVSPGRNSGMSLPAVRRRWPRRSSCLDQVHGLFVLRLVAARQRAVPERPHGARSGPAAVAVYLRPRVLSPRRDLRMIPRSQHFGDRAPFPFTEVGYSADIREAPVRSSLPLRWKAAPITPGSRRTQASRITIAAELAAGQDIVADRDLLDRGLEDPLVESLEAAAQEDDAWAEGELAHAAWVSGFRAGSGEHRLPSATLSRAAASTSARSTIPAPPPAGVSSTLRCLSVAKSRMWTVSSDQTPSSSARPARLRPSGPGNISG